MSRTIQQLYKRRKLLQQVFHVLPWYRVTGLVMSAIKDLDDQSLSFFEFRPFFDRRNESGWQSGQFRDPAARIEITAGIQSGFTLFTELHIRYAVPDGFQTSLQLGA